jgi:hypothetical protein
MRKTPINSSSKKYFIQVMVNDGITEAKRIFVLPYRAVSVDLATG